MGKNIRISKKHGVNPSMAICFFCNQDKGEIILTGRLPNDAEAPMRACWDMEPCDECKGYMEQGIILISCRDNETDKQNPYRTGGWCVISDEAFSRIFSGDIVDKIMKKRVCFIPDEVWDTVGFPRGEVQNENHGD